MLTSADELLKSGVIYLNGEVKEETMKSIIVDILYLNNLNREDRPLKITLIINSPGGSVSEAFTLIDIMEMSNIPVETIGFGMIASCGLLIFMTGTNRRITNKTSILSHQYAWGNQGKFHELVAQRREEDLMGTRLIEHYKKHTKLPIKTIKEKLLTESDTWLSAGEAIKYNLADKIINKL